METSSAETGSSATISFGLTARARAIPMRWRWPPENSCGYRRRCSALRPTVSSRCTTRSSRSRLVLASLWMTSASPMIEPTVIRGFSEAYGSWKMICMSRRKWRSDRLSSVVTFWSPNHTSPAVGSIRRRMQRPVVDLPQPDSPTKPSVSPRRISNDTSSTAWTRATSREKSPPRIGKYFLRFLILSSGVSAMGGTPLPLVEPAGDFVARLDFFEHGVLLRAHGLYERAARSEAAAGGDVAPQRGDRARDGLEPAPLRRGQIDAWDRA